MVYKLDKTAAEINDILNNADNSIINVAAFGAVGDGVTDDTAAIQDALTSALDLAVSNGDNFASAMVIIPSGKYKLTSTINHYPGIKVVANGPVLLDFSNIADGDTAWRINNELWTVSGSSSSPGMHSAMSGYCLNGNSGPILILGKYGDPTSVGLDVGGETSQSDYKTFRNFQINNVQVEGFGVNLFIRNVDTYLATFDNVKLKHAYTACIQTQYTGTQTNSGEKFVFNNLLMANSQDSSCVGLDLRTPGMNFVFNHCACDYINGSFLKISAGNQTPGYQAIICNDCWFETCFDNGFVNSTLASNPTALQIVFNNPHIVLYFGSTHSTNGYDCPIQTLFRGYMNLHIKAPHFGGWSNPCLSTNGLWLCDSNVNLVEYSDEVWSGWPQLPSKSSIMNYNWNFNTGTSGDVLTYKQNIDGWHLENQSGISAQLSNTQVFDSSSNSLKLTATNSTNYLVLQSDPIPVNKLKTARMETILYGGTSTGALRVQSVVEMLRPYNFPKFKITGIERVGSRAIAFTDIDHKMSTYQRISIGQADQSDYNGIRVVSGVTDTTKSPASISSVTRSGGTVTVTTSSAHGLSQYESVTISGCTETEYNGTHAVASVTTNTFTYTISTTPTTPATGTPVYVMAYGFNYRLDGSTATTPATGTITNTPEPFKVVGSSSTIGSDFGTSIYTNTSDPDYDGTRNHWAKEKYNVKNTNDDIGSTHFRIKTTFSSWANGDVVYCGGIPIVTV